MFDDLRVEVGEVGEGAFPDLAVVAPGLSQQHGGRRVAVRDNVDIHGDLLNIHDNICQYPYGHYMVTILTPKKPRTRVNTREKLLQGGKFGLVRKIFAQGDKTLRRGGAPRRRTCAILR